jgi:2-dehydropantoate 2-reductase
LLVSAGRGLIRGRPEEDADRAKEFSEDGTDDQTAAESAAAEEQSMRGAMGERNLQQVSQFYRQQPVYDRRVHIIGVGSMGRFIAHSLRGIPNPPPVTLILHGWQMLDMWNESSRSVGLVTDGGEYERREGFDAETVWPRRRFHGKEIGLEGEDGPVPIREGESTEPITSLIVCTKAPMVLQALSAVKHRLSKDSVVLFLQSGMGTIEEVNREIFPDPETRPRYMRGIVTHSTLPHVDDPFTAVYKGSGTLSLGLLPHEREGGALPYSPPSRFAPGSRTPHQYEHSLPEDPNLPPPQEPGFKWTPNDRYLLRTLLRTPALCATAFSPPDLLQMQLERLAVNSIIGPLTVMLDSRNGGILYNYSLTRTMRLLLSETSLVLRSLPELQYIPNVAQRFDPGRLETFTVGFAHRTRDQIHLMLDDVRRGNRTEIDYVNGWIVRRGEELGIRCFMNYMMVNLVKGKGNMIQHEMGEDVPFLTEKNEGEIVLKGEGKGVVGSEEPERE